MSNNSMVLVNHVAKTVVPIAKYYPDTGWYCIPNAKFETENISALLDAAFDAAIEHSSFGVKNPWSLAYETDDCWNDMVKNYKWINRISIEDNSSPSLPWWRKFFEIPKFMRS